MPKTTLAMTLAAHAARLLSLTLATTLPQAVLAEPKTTSISTSNTAALNNDRFQQEIDRYQDWESNNQVTSVNQFSDVRPTDWSYQALSNLVETYGCVAGHPNGMFKGGQSVSRFEAAALLNACLEHISEQTDTLKRLLNEFNQELIALRGRVIGLDKRISTLESQQFSTTTKFSGQATMVVGGNWYNGSAINTTTNTVNRNTGAAVDLYNAVTFNYDLQLNFDTSFTGKDLLRTNLRTGNFGNSRFGGEPHSLGNLSELQIAYEEPNGANVLGVFKLFYQLPLGGGWTATVGPRVGQEDMMALWPSVYPSETVLNVMTVNGAPAAYNKNLGAGAGLWWQNNNWSISANYVAFNGMKGNPGIPPAQTGGISTGGGGIGNKASGASGSVQLAYQQEQWGLAAVWTYLQPYNAFVPGVTPTVHSSIDHNANALTNAFGLSAYWQPWNSGWAPSVSIGWGYNNTSYSTAQATGGAVSTSQSWMLGLQWTDVFAIGNDFGIAVAQPVYATTMTGGVNANDGNYVWEWWYKVQVTDKISVTPALIYLSRPLGQRTPANATFDQMGALVKTTFRF